jgi:serine protease
LVGRRSWGAALVVALAVGSTAPAAAHPGAAGAPPGVAVATPAAPLLDAPPDDDRPPKPTDPAPLPGALGDLADLEAGDAVPGELVVTFADTTGDADGEALVATAGAEITATGDDVALVETEPGSEDAVMWALAADPRVEHVEPNLRRQISWVPNDPRYAAQRDQLDVIRVGRAWNRSRGAGVTVAVLDTGIDRTHPDLASNIVHASSTVGGGAGDFNGHGTAMAGAIAARAGNGVGIAGVAPRAKIMSIKVLGPGGGGDFQIAKGINRAVNRGADVISMSFGGPGSSDVLDRALERAASEGVLLVAASGNDGTTLADFPAAHRDVLSVGAVDEKRRVASFSNHGRTLDVVAPGVRVLTTLPGGRYGRVWGTSPAAAVASGVGALVKSVRPGMRGAALRSLLQRTAHDRGAPGSDPAFGAGVVDAAAAVRAAPTRPTSRPRPLSGDRDAYAHGAVPLTGGGAYGRIELEYDEDWYELDLPGPRRVEIRVAPPRNGSVLTMDPVLQVWDAQMRLLVTRDETFEGQAETAVVRVPAGPIYIRVLSYVASQSPGRYRITSSTSAISGNFTAPQATRLFWTTRVAPANRSTKLGRRPTIRSVLSPGLPDVDLGRIRLRLVHGRTGAVIASTRTFDAPTRTVAAQPTKRLPRGTPITAEVRYTAGGGTTVIDVLHYAVAP